MKKFLITTILTYFIILSQSSATGNSTSSISSVVFKIGYFNMDSLMMLMPEVRAAEDSIEDYTMQLENVLVQMQAYLEHLTGDLQDTSNHMAPMVRQLKQKEIVDLTQRIEEFEKVAQDELVHVKDMVMKPIYAKIKAAAQNVATRLGYAYILDSGEDKTPVVYASRSYNVFNEMCVELKIPVPKK